MQSNAHQVWEYCSNSIKNCDIKDLHKNREFMGTMFCESFVEQEYQYLLENYENNAEYINGITNESLPNLSNGNLIHQLYHITNFHNYVGDKLFDEPITEFGAGYGGLCKIIHRLEFENRYNIIELPNLQGLQGKYLENYKDIHWYSNYKEFLKENRYSGTFIALWSLSEAPQEIRDYYLYKTHFHQYFFAYGDEFYDMKNLEYFNRFTEIKSSMIWQKVTIPFMSGQYYLMGKQC